MKINFRKLSEIKNIRHLAHYKLITAAVCTVIIGGAVGGTVIYNRAASQGYTHKDDAETIANSTIGKKINGPAENKTALSGSSSNNGTSSTGTSSTSGTSGSSSSSSESTAKNSNTASTPSTSPSNKATKTDTPKSDSKNNNLGASGQAKNTGSPSQSTNKPSASVNSNQKGYPSQSGWNTVLESQIREYDQKDPHGDYKQPMYPKLDAIFNKFISKQISASQATSEMLAIRYNYNDGMYTNVRCISSASSAMVKVTSSNNAGTIKAMGLLSSGDYGNNKIWYDANTHTNTIYSMGASIDAD